MGLWRNRDTRERPETRVVLAALLFAGSAWGSSSPASARHELLEKIRAQVLEQVRIGGNYMCVQTADRHYYRPKEFVQSGCDHPLRRPDENTEIMTDRLRLSVAVSENREIYSWYGQQHFQNGTIDELITNGPITTGGFGGFLRNVFLSGGIEFTYTGHSVLNGVPEDSFDYSVPLAHSGYAVTTKRGPVVVAFRGSFSANSNTFELTNLVVEVPQGPPDSHVCYARSSIAYQMARVSGNDVLIPDHFDFRLDDTDHILTDSQFEYRSCHAFTGESTINFDISDEANAGNRGARPITKAPLRADLRMSVQLRTSIDDRNSYTGDPVEGVLLHPVKLAHSDEAIPKGALVKGIITQLEYFPNPEPHHLLSVLFNQVIDGTVIYPTRATHLAPPETSLLSPQFRGRGSRGSLIASQPLPGHDEMLEIGRHFQLNAGYKSEWVTRSVEPTKR